MKLNPVKTLGWFLTCHSIGQADRQSVSQSVTWKQRNGLIYTCILVFFMLACSQQQLHLSHNQQYFLSIQANKGLQISALDETLSFGQFTLSTRLIKLNYLVPLLPKLPSLQAFSWLIVWSVSLVSQLLQSVPQSVNQML